MAFDVIVVHDYTIQKHSFGLNILSIVLWTAAGVILIRHFLGKASQNPKILKISSLLFCLAGFWQFLTKMIISAYILYAPAEGNPADDDAETERIFNLSITLSAFLFYASFYVFITSRLRLSFIGSSKDIKTYQLIIIYIAEIIATLSIASFLFVQYLETVEAVFTNEEYETENYILCDESNQCQNMKSSNNTTIFEVECFEDGCNDISIYSNAFETFIYCDMNGCNNVDIYCYDDINKQHRESCVVHCNGENSCNNIELHCNDNNINWCAIETETSYSVQNTQLYCNLTNNYTSDDIGGCAYECFESFNCFNIDSDTPGNNVLYCNTTDIYGDYPCICDGDDDTCASVDFYVYGHYIEMIDDDYTWNDSIIVTTSSEIWWSEEEEDGWSSESEEEGIASYIYLECFSEITCDIMFTLLWIFIIFDILIRIFILYLFNTKLLSIMVNIYRDEPSRDVSGAKSSISSSIATNDKDGRILHVVIRQTVLMSLMIIVNFLDYIISLFSSDFLFHEYAEFISYTVQIICFLLSFGSLKHSTDIYKYLCCIGQLIIYHCCQCLVGYQVTKGNEPSIIQMGSVSMDGTAPTNITQLESADSTHDTSL